MGGGAPHIISFYSAKVCSVFANFLVYLLKESTSLKQDLNKLMTNIPELSMASFKRLYQHLSSVCWQNLSFGSVVFKWEQNVKICKFQ